MFKTSCFEIWRNEEETTKIITLCKDFDIQLGGGIPRGLITEFCGAPGSGKTQICLQLCINVQFPKDVGGIEGKAIYVDTNQGFHPDRLKEMATCMEQRFRRIFAKVNTSSTPMPLFNSSSILNNILYNYCPNYVHLMAFIINLKSILMADRLIKLVVIDSFAFPLRSVEPKDRVHRIYEMLTELHDLCLEYGIAVVLTNELTTKAFGNNWKICPALGDCHYHKVNQRIILSKETSANQHVAFIEKSVISPKIGIPFQIKASGIRGVT